MLQKEARGMRFLESGFQDNAQELWWLLINKHKKTKKKRIGGRTMNLVDKRAQHYRDTYNRNYQEQGLDVIPIRYIDEIKPWKVEDKPQPVKRHWLSAALRFLRERWVAFAAIVVIGGWGLLMYAMAVALLEW